MYRFLVWYNLFTKLNYINKIAVEAG